MVGMVFTNTTVRNGRVRCYRIVETFLSSTVVLAQATSTRLLIVNRTLKYSFGKIAVL
jgi:hypothetical protein